MSHHADPGSLAATACVLRRAADETEALAAQLPQMGHLQGTQSPKSSDPSNGYPSNTETPDQRHLLLLTARGLAELADAVSQYANDVMALPAPRSTTVDEGTVGPVAETGSDLLPPEFAALMPDTTALVPHPTGLCVVQDPSGTQQPAEPLLEQLRLAQALEIATQTLWAALTPVRGKQ